MKKAIRIGFRIFIVAAGLTGVVLQISGSPRAVMVLSYYTIQSNLICIALFVALVLAELFGKRPSEGKGYRIIKGAATVCILLTFVVFHFMLRPTLIDVLGMTYLNSPDNLLPHYVVPLAVLGDYLLFDQKGQFRKFYPLVWPAIPLAYLGYTAIYRLLGGVYYFGESEPLKFPYFFLDYETYGLEQVTVWVLLIAAGYVAFGYLLAGLDYLLGRLAKPARH